MAMFRVGYLIGSLAKGSLNRKLAKALIKLAPEPLFQFIERVYMALPRNV